MKLHLSSEVRLKNDILPFHVTELAQALPEGLEERTSIVTKELLANPVIEIADPGNMCGPLRPDRRYTDAQG